MDAPTSPTGESNPYALGLLQLQLMREREKALRECQVEDDGVLAALTSEAKAARKRGLQARKRVREEAAAAPLRRSTRVAGIKLDPESLPADFREPSAADLARGFEPKYSPPAYDKSVVLDEVLDRKHSKQHALAICDAARAGLAVLVGLPAPPLFTGVAPPAAPAAGGEGEEASSSSSSSASPVADPLRHYPDGGFLPPGGGFHDARAGGWDITDPAEEGGAKGSKGHSPARGKRGASSGGAGGIEDKWTRRGGRSPSRLAGLEIRTPKHVMKVVPDRIYNVGFLPCTDRVVTYIGSKDGRLALWAPDQASVGDGKAAAEEKTRAAADKAVDEEEEGADAPRAKRARLEGKAASDDEGEGEEGSAKEEDDEEEDDGLHTFAVFHPHSAPVSDVAIPRGAPHLLLTCAYDGTVRAMDLNRGVSWGLSRPIEHQRDGLSCMVLAGSYAGGGAGAADGLDATGYGFSLFTGAYEGEARHIDTRAPGYAGGQPWQAHDRKVSSMSLVPDSPYLLSASSDATVKIWDVRKLPLQSTAGGKKGHGSPSPVLTLHSRQAITSACWSPHGRHIAAVCNEDVIRIWDAATPTHTLGAPERMPAGGLIVDAEGGGRLIKHNNHTGRWLTTFRALWDPANDDTLLCGGMDRTLDIFSASRGSCVSSKTQELLTAVPTRNNVHPCPDMDLVISATASGRVYLWT